MLRIINLSKRYGRKKVLHNASLNIPSTGIHILRGDNGNGKTTLLKCLAGLERYQGRILWHNDSLVNNVSTAFDDSAVHGSLTGLQNLRSLLDASSKVVENAHAVQALVHRDLLAKKSATYSLGQRKKIKLVAAFAAGKPCILLDEPLSGLDSAGRAGLAEMLEVAAATSCVIISDHESSFYHHLASSEFIIRQGRIVHGSDEPHIKVHDADE